MVADNDMQLDRLAKGGGHGWLEGQAGRQTDRQRDRHTQTDKTLQRMKGRTDRDRHYTDRQDTDKATELLTDKERNAFETESYTHTHLANCVQKVNYQIPVNHKPTLSSKMLPDDFDKLHACHQRICHPPPELWQQLLHNRLTQTRVFYRSLQKQ